MSATGPVRALTPEQLTPELAEQLAPRMERLGYLGAFFTHTAHQPEALLAFVRFTEALKHAIPSDHTEVVALTLARLLGNDYERHQHEQLSVKLGFGEDWVRAVEALAPEDAPRELTSEQALVQALALAVARSEGHGARSELQQVVDELGEEAAVGILLLIARYIAHAVVSNTLGLSPPVPSIFNKETIDGS